jgi:DNA-binding ferritin-like protein
MEQFNLLISYLVAICNYSKDIHYNSKGSAFYSKHILADLVLDGLDEKIDDIKENVFLGNGIEPLPSGRYLMAAAALVPPISKEDRLNFIMLKGLVNRVRELIKTMEGPSRGANSLLDAIGEHLDKMAGLLHLQVKDNAVSESEFKKEECEGCTERDVDRAKAELAKVDLNKVAEVTLDQSNQHAAMCEENTLDKLSKKLGL